MIIKKRNAKCVHIACIICLYLEVHHLISEYQLFQLIYLINIQDIDQYQTPWHFPFEHFLHLRISFLIRRKIPCHKVTLFSFFANQFIYHAFVNRIIHTIKMINLFIIIFIICFLFWIIFSCFLFLHFLLFYRFLTPYKNLSYFINCKKKSILWKKNFFF